MQFCLKNLAPLNVVVWLNSRVVYSFISTLLGLHGVPCLALLPLTLRHFQVAGPLALNTTSRYVFKFHVKCPKFHQITSNSLAHNPI